MGPPNAALLVRIGSRQWRFVPGDPVSIGRGVGCDLVVDDARLSREHLRITYRDGWTVEDAGSRNGTWVHGRRLRAEPVDGRLLLTLGDRRSGPVVALELDDTPTSATPRSGSHALTIGRARDNDITLNDVLVSRYHARVETTPAGRQVVDLGSRNRTLVNGVVAAPALPLAEGDRLSVGSTEFHVDGADLRPTTLATRRLIAAEVSYQVPRGDTIVAGIDLDVGPGELVAVIGPSGAGKSTLLKLLTGQLQPSSGTVSYDGYDVYKQFDAVRSLLGLVPQDDVVHRRLTVRQALAFAARLRLPDDTTRAERQRTVDGVLAELGLTEHRRARVDRLSGGQRKRVSIALELLTSPSLLLLDEPTSGLDPALDKHIMATLRSLADGGRTVVVVTHNVAYLDRCDRVLLLAPGGLPVYCGRPAGVLPHFGGGDWADVFARVIDGPIEAHRNFVRVDSGRARRREAPATRQQAAAVSAAPWPMRMRQAWTLAARHAALIAADRTYLLFLLLLPVALAALALAVPGGAGLLPPRQDMSGEPGQILVLLFVGAAFAGGAVAAREVVGERAIVVRERAAGLHPTAYALAKLGIFGAVCGVQAAILTVGVALAKPVPEAGVVLGSGQVELAVAVWCTALASCQLSLFCSALVRSAEQVMPVLVVTVMAQLVLCGGLIPVTGRPGINQLSWLAPARWGYAAGAATADLRRISPDVPGDALWRHAPGPWLLSIAALITCVLGVTALVAVQLGRLERS